MSASLRCRFSPHTTPLRVYQQAPVSLRRCSCRLAPARGALHRTRKMSAGEAPVSETPSPASASGMSPARPDGRALLPPPVHGGVHRRAHAGTGPEDASAGTGRVSKGARVRHGQSLWHFSMLDGDRSINLLRFQSQILQHMRHPLVGISLELLAIGRIPELEKISHVLRSHVIR